LGFTLSRPIVHGLTSAGSASPTRVIDTAQPSSFSFLITRAIHPAFFHSRGFEVSSSTSRSMSPSSRTGVTMRVRSQIAGERRRAARARSGHVIDNSPGDSYRGRPRQAMTSLHIQRFDQRAAAVEEARGRATDYARICVFPGRP